jgi:hypothetical protein
MLFINRCTVIFTKEAFQGQLDTMAKNMVYSFAQLASRTRAQAGSPIFDRSFLLLECKKGSATLVDRTGIDLL